MQYRDPDLSPSGRSCHQTISFSKVKWTEIWVQLISRKNTTVWLKVFSDVVALLSPRALLCQSILNNTLGTGEVAQWIKRLLCKPGGSEFKSPVSMQNLVVEPTSKLGRGRPGRSGGFADKLV